MSSQKILNQLPTILTNHFTKQVLDRHCISVIGYGSGVFPQTSSSTSHINTIDLMLVVKNARNFHQEMMQIKRNDYAGLVGLFGVEYLDLLQRYVFPAHFNHIQTQTLNLKYAVIDQQTLITDLTTWNYLTFAGRFHKPILANILNQPLAQKQLLSAIQINHGMALNISILRMLGKIKEKQPIELQRLYKNISQISYVGDIRYLMAVQNVNKVQNIVRNNKRLFDGIYLPLIRRLAAHLLPGTLKVNDSNTHFQIKYTPQLIGHILEIGPFPSSILEQLKDMPTGGKQYRSLTEKVLMNGVIYMRKQIDNNLAKTNKRSSTRMAMQNFLGASFTHNIKYILAKINKKNLK